MPLWFLPTPHQCMRLAQALSSNAAALSTAAMTDTGAARQGLRRMVPPIAYFSVAFVTRMILQETESRLQIAAFALAATLIEALRSRAERRRFDGLQWGLNTAAAAAGVLLAKHILEPGSITEFTQRVLDLIADL